MKQDYNESNAENEVLDDSTEGLFENYRIIVDKGQGLMRLDKFLAIRIENVTRNKIQQALKSGLVTVNQSQKNSNYKVKPDDLIQVFLPTPPTDNPVIAQDIPLDVVYEDADVLIVNKQSDMVVHPAYGNWDGTLLNALKFHFQKQEASENDPVMPLLVHRIDKDTTGLLVIAKNEPAQFFLAQQFAEHSCERTYTALVWGDLKEDEGVIEGHVGRNLKDRKIMSVFSDGDKGKHAVTHWTVLKRYGYVTLVQCRLETGRTHQIRVHFKHIGHPIFNDATYGGNQILKGISTGKYRQFILNGFQFLPRQALHATTLGFVHPTTSKKVSFASDLPNDMKAVIAKWDNYIANRE